MIERNEEIGNGFFYVGVEESIICQTKGQRIFEKKWYRNKKKLTTGDQRERIDLKEALRNEGEK